MLDSRAVDLDDSLCFVAGELCHLEIASTRLNVTSTTPGGWKTFEGPFYLPGFPEGKLWPIIMPVLRTASVHTTSADCELLKELCVSHGYLEWAGDAIFCYLVISAQSDANGIMKQITGTMGHVHIQAAQLLLEKTKKNALFTPQHASLFVSFLYTLDAVQLIRGIVALKNVTHGLNIVRALELSYRSDSDVLCSMLVADLMKNDYAYTNPDGHYYSNVGWYRQLAHTYHNYHSILAMVNSAESTYNMGVPAAERVFGGINERLGSFCTMFAKGNGEVTFMVYDKDLTTNRVCAIDGVVYSSGKKVVFAEIQRTRGTLTTLTVPPVSILIIPKVEGTAWPSVPISHYLDAKKLIVKVLHMHSQVAKEKGVVDTNEKFIAAWDESHREMDAWTILGHSQHEHAFVVHTIKTGEVASNTVIYASGGDPYRSIIDTLESNRLTFDHFV